jgi:hypothetical protein
MTNDVGSQTEVWEAQGSNNCPNVYMYLSGSHARPGAQTNSVDTRDGESEHQAAINFALALLCRCHSNGAALANLEQNAS